MVLEQVLRISLVRVSFMRGFNTSLDNPFSFKKFVKTKSKTQQEHTRYKDSNSSISSDEGENVLPPPPILSDPLPQLPQSLPVSDPITQDLFSSDSDIELSDPLKGGLPQPVPMIISDPLTEPTVEIKNSDESDEEGSPFEMNPFPNVAVLAPDESQYQLLSELKKVD